MKLCIIGGTHAPTIFREVWGEMGFEIIPEPREADLTFISEDTPTDAEGNRDQEHIRAMVGRTWVWGCGPLVLTSQVEPGFTRSLELPIYHMAETLRIKDAKERARNPEQLIFGVPEPNAEFPAVLRQFSNYFPGAAVLQCSYEAAEFAKVAINVSLARQVETVNELNAAAERLRVHWDLMQHVLYHDKRIGAYTTPGRWQDSPHLLRDWVTFQRLGKTHVSQLEALLARRPPYLRNTPPFPQCGAPENEGTSFPPFPENEGT